MHIFRNLLRTMKKLTLAGVKIVAAAGNRELSSQLDEMTSCLKDGNAIMVGSHNNSDAISTFSLGKCSANICSFGDGVYLESVRPNVRSGTSFSAPYVTAVIANLLSYLPTLPKEIDLRQFLIESADQLDCICDKHRNDSDNGKVKLKMNSTSFMQANVLTAS